MNQKKQKPKIFRGWIILAVAIAGSFTGTGIGAYGLSVFLKAMSSDLRWSRTAVSGVVTLRALIMAFLGPVIGPFVDREYGPKLLYVSAAIIGFASLVLSGIVNQVWQFYLFGGIFWGLCQGVVSGHIVAGSVVAKWFIRYRGRAMGILATGGSLGGIVFVPLCAFLISSFGWRSAWMILGILPLVLILPGSLLFMRRQPEDIGLFPDGIEIVNDEKNNSQNEIRENNWTLKEAIKTRSLWFMVISFNLMGMSIGVLALHQVALFTDKGLSIEAASLLATSFSTVSLISKFFWGILCEKIPIRFVTASSLGIAAIAIGTLWFAQDFSELLIYTILYGIGAGATAVVQNVMWSNYYGRFFQGTIRGVLTPLNLLGPGLSPLWSAWIFDVYGTYNPALIILLVGCGIGAILQLLATPPVKIHD
ncbi:MAG: hypothetical protein CL785_00045 [Chloroflexi bacterium]|nr:hypothetical protein [Chloroflexota bacterium]|tara:strand:+ start:8215 stop:9477 length:1263 start_codon:yes stop_codon:yes gene_type:complete